MQQQDVHTNYGTHPECVILGGFPAAAGRSCYCHIGLGGGDNGHSHMAIQVHDQNLPRFDTEALERTMKQCKGIIKRKMSRESYYSNPGKFTTRLLESLIFLEELEWIVWNVKVWKAGGDAAAIRKVGTFAEWATTAK